MLQYSSFMTQKHMHGICLLLPEVCSHCAATSATVKQLAEYLEPMLTAAAGGSLDAYRR